MSSINLCTLQIENGEKKIIVVIDALSGTPTVYSRTYAADLNTNQQAAYDALISWANSQSGGNFPTSVPDPAPEDPIIDRIIIQILNGAKNSLCYRANDDIDTTCITYANLSSGTQTNYDILVSWADSVDSGFI